MHVHRGSSYQGPKSPINWGGGGGGRSTRANKRSKYAKQLLLEKRIFDIFGPKLGPFSDTTVGAPGRDQNQLLTVIRFWARIKIRIKIRLRAKITSGANISLLLSPAFLGQDQMLDQHETFDQNQILGQNASSSIISFLSASDLG